MECTGFLERFSEFHDGEAADSVAFERHARKCARCRRYVDTVTRGLALLRAFPDIAVCEDFHPRLQHRIYNVREDLARRRRGASFTRVGVALAATILLALAIWGPELLRPTPEVALPPIVVSAPPSARADAPAATVRYRGIHLRGPGLTGDDLWDKALYEYSSLSQR